MSQLFAPQLDADRLESNSWVDTPTDQLIKHIEINYHQRHREQLPELIRLARRVEQVHGSHQECPNGLADHLSEIQQALESHMLKEEQILFPMLLRGEYDQSRGPISVMRFEHEQHDEGLDKLRALTNDIQPPAHSCNTWRTLYQKLHEFCQELTQHIQLENEVLFTRPESDQLL